MPDILDTAHLDLEECAERLEANQITPHACVYAGRDAESAIRLLQMTTANAAPGLKAKADDLADELHEKVNYFVSEGPLNSANCRAHQEDIEELRRIIDEARNLAWDLRDDDFDLNDIRNSTTISERFEAIGRAVYDHPDLMEEALDELFRREASLEPPFGWSE